MLGLDFGVGFFDFCFLDQIALDFLGWSAVSLRSKSVYMGRTGRTLSSICAVRQVGWTNREAFSLLAFGLVFLPLSRFDVGSFDTHSNVLSVFPTIR